MITTKIKSWLFFAVFMLSSIFYTNAQDYLMPFNGTNSISATHTVCSGNFYDDGGPGSNYNPGGPGFFGSGTTREITFFPGITGTRVRVTFTSFNLHSGGFLVMADELTITGSDNNGTYTGTNSPGVVTSTNPDGSVHFSFVCGEADQAAGWVATISLVGPDLSYSGSPFCTTGTVNPTWTGGSPLTGGTYSSAPAGLNINSSTGVIDLATSSAGNYTVTYTQSCTAPLGGNDFSSNATLAVVPAITTSTSASICNGASYTFGTQTLTTAGTYNETFYSASGCDSTVTLTLSVVPAITTSASASICNGSSYTFGTQTLTTAGTYTETFSSASGCDSTVTLTLTTGASITNSISANECSGTTYTFGSQSITTSGTYVETFAAASGCDSIVTLTIVFNNCSTPIAAFTVSSNSICFGDCITLTDISENTPANWTWTFNGANQVSSNLQNPGEICFDNVGTFTIQLDVSNAFGTSSATQTIVVGEAPDLYAIGDTIIEMGGTAVLGAVSTNAVAYNWIPSADIDCPGCPVVEATPLISTSYIVQAISGEGCITQDTVNVIVNFVNVVDLPNSFSPNGDGVNDVLYVKGVGIVSMKLVIYNRYGQKVFESESQNDGWDGKFNGQELNSGSFAYVLDYSLIDGLRSSKKGSVTLVK